jgi:hypothetical protein
MSMIDSLTSVVIMFVISRKDSLRCLSTSGNLNGKKSSSSIILGSNFPVFVGATPESVGCLSEGIGSSFCEF